VAKNCPKTIGTTDPKSFLFPPPVAAAILLKYRVKTFDYSISTVTLLAGCPPAVSTTFVMPAPIKLREITFGKVSFLPAIVNSDHAAVLTVDVISPLLQEIHLAMEQHANCKPSDSDYQPHAIVAHIKPKAVKKYVGNKLLAGRRMEVSTLSIRPKAGEPEFVQLIDAPASWKEDNYNYNWRGDEVKSPQRKRAKSSSSRTGASRRPRGDH